MITCSWLHPTRSPNFFTTSELIDGPSLARRIGHAPQDPRWSARILARVADALDFVNQLKLQRTTDGEEEDPGPGILHRDVKPSNILLGRGDQPILTDFGLAGRVGRAASDEGFVAGTAAYSAPEQLRADAVLTPAVDVYGLGATLYHLLTGRPPRREPAPDDRGGANAELRLIPPRRLARRIPNDLERICLKCLEDDPSRRYQSAGAVRDDLHRFRDGEPVSIHPVGLWGRAVRWARHRPLAATLAAGLVLALSIGLLATAWLWRRAETASARADSERREAEADFVLASQILERFADSISIRDYDPTSTASFESSLLPLLQRGRQQLLALLRHHPHHLAAHKWLARTDNRLAEILVGNGARHEAHTVLVEAQESLDRAIAGSSTDPVVLSEQLWTYHLDSQLAADEGIVEDAIAYQERALHIYERQWALEPTRAIVLELADRRSDLATRLLAQRGREARARSLIEASIRMLADDPRGASDPAMAIRRVFAHEDLRQLGPNGSSEPTAPGAAPGTDALSRLISPKADDLGPEDWASAFIEMFPMSPTSGGTSSILERGSFWSFVPQSVSRATARRHAGRLDQARRIADRLHAVARRLVARYPDDAAAHWALSQAHFLIYKNAWRTNDRADVERLKLAANAATHALVLDPNSAVLRRHRADLQEKLDKLLSPPRSISASDPAGRPGARN